MTAAIIDLVIDPAPAAGPAQVRLFAADSEWARAVGGLRRRGRGVERDLLLDLHAYEMLERLREVLVTRSGRVEVVAPFWPAACHEAAEVAAHPGRELAALLPPLATVRGVVRTPESFGRAAMAVFGLIPFDPGRYVAALTSAAAVAPWLLTAVEGASLPSATLHSRSRRQPVRETASGLIVRDGQILLERRSPAAQSHPGALDTPGGHVEAGESPRDCLARELGEELGVEGVRAHLVACQEEDGSAVGGAYLHHVYLVESFSGTPAPREGQALEWWDLRVLAGAEAPERLNPLVAWIIREGLARGWLDRGARGPSHP